MVAAALLLVAAPLADLDRFAPLPAVGRTFMQVFPRLTAGVTLTPTDTPERKRLAELRETLILNYKLVADPTNRAASTMLNIIQVAHDTGWAAVASLPPGEAWCREVTVIQRLAGRMLAVEYATGRYAAADIPPMRGDWWMLSATGLRAKLAERR